MQKILLISHKFSPDIGGIETNSEILAEAFIKAGHQVRVITWSVDQNNKKFAFDVIRNPSIFTLIKHHLWATVIFENNPSLRLSWPNFFVPKPLVIALNTWISRPDGRLAAPDRIKRFWLKRAVSVIAVSKSVRDKSWPQAIVIPNPYRKQYFRNIPGTIKFLDFVFLGRLVSDKGADMAIRAMAGFRGCKLTIIGEGPEMPALQELTSSLKLENNVKFAGTLRGEALSELLNAHRFILVPSVWEEPFGNVALEGMACGCIPIVSNGGGLPEAVGSAGLTFERGNQKSLEITLDRICKDPALQTELKSFANDHLARHSIESISAEYLQIIYNASQA